MSASSLESIHYEAGKLFDRLGDYDRAFKHFEAANNSRPSRFQPAEHSAHVDAIKLYLTGAFYQQRQDL